MQTKAKNLYNPITQSVESISEKILSNYSSTRTIIILLLVTVIKLLALYLYIHLLGLNIEKTVHLLDFYNYHINSSNIVDSFAIYIDVFHNNAKAMPKWYYKLLKNTPSYSLYYFIVISLLTYLFFGVSWVIAYDLIQVIIEHSIHYFSVDTKQKISNLLLKVESIL